MSNPSNHHPHTLHSPYLVATERSEQEQGSAFAQSVDPLVAERLAAAIAVGCQAIPLCSATTARVLDRLRRRVAQPNLRASQVVNQTVTRFETLHNHTSEWKSIGEGIAVRQVSKTEQVETFLIRIAPGAVLPGHEHDFDEESMLIEGDYWMGEQYFSTPGDIQFWRAGTTHVDMHSPKGCTLCVSLDLLSRAT